MPAPGLPVQTLLFDFDQTLVDSGGPVTHCINYAFERLGRPPVTEIEARSTIGLTLADAYRRLTGDDSASGSRAFRSHYHAVAEDVVVQATELLPGTFDALETLAATGYAMGIVSTKRRDRIEAILNRLGIADLFRSVVGGNDVSRHKPDPEGLHMSVRRLDAKASATLFVGDHVVDGGAARAGGVPFVAVLTGSVGRDALMEYRPLAVLDAVDALPAWLSSGAPVDDPAGRPGDAQ